MRRIIVYKKDVGEPAQANSRSKLLPKSRTLRAEA